MIKELSPLCIYAYECIKTSWSHRRRNTSAVESLRQKLLGLWCLVSAACYVEFLVCARVPQQRWFCGVCFGCCSARYECCICEHKMAQASVTQPRCDADRYRMICKHCLQIYIAHADRQMGQCSCSDCSSPALIAGWQQQRQ